MSNPAKPITGGELLDLYANRIEVLEDALAAFLVTAFGGPEPSAAQFAVAKDVAHKLDALPSRPGEGD